MSSTLLLCYIKIIIVVTKRCTVACTEVKAMDRDESAILKEDNDGSSMANDEAEIKHDSSEVFSGEVEFTVGKSPASNKNIDSTGALDNERGVSVLGEGSPKVILFCAILLVMYMKADRQQNLYFLIFQSERSADMFCDDIFGESPAAIRKPV
jgi:serine/threonine-protein kinase PRP4